ncbi:VOC family protein [Roseimicrobium sp. ORNL1]|uniref:VOC family protein n=1 Tax=Roseimicrobium sp. ORNL1 TaxID=2711231 RepID=UPI0013E11A58|nr:VOC family protein [Roseimicrobium sp. ORNL1]QIF01603.1 VOC family protein [Roseimicrobium sp. ORNL1]
MSAPVKKKPDGYHSVTPSLVIRNAAEALDFYKKAFDAKEVYRLGTPEGKIVHGEIQIGDSRVMVSDEFPEWESFAPQSIGGTPATLLIYVDDVDAAYRQALEAGASKMSEPADQFWGDRMAGLYDPYGHRWSLATHIENVSPEEISRRAGKFFGADIKDLCAGTRGKNNGEKASAGG